MLQRVQTVYLFIVFIFSLLFVNLPLAHFPAESLTPLRIITHSHFFALADLEGAWLGVLLIILFALSALLTIYTTFLYKKRLQQIRIGKLNMILHAAMVLATFFFIDHIRSQANDTDFSYGVAVLFPIISMILLLMANRAIRRDEELVRSADRFR